MIQQEQVFLSLFFSLLKKIKLNLKIKFFLVQKRIAIGLKDGNVVDIDPTLSPSELKNSLTKESKEELYSHLTVLQLQLQSLMEKITEPN